MRKVIIFDIDGVLLDSLPSHLAICKDLAEKYGVHVDIPKKEEFIEHIVRNGVQISPMYHFFRAVGFDDLQAKAADEEYVENFSVNYSPQPYDGVLETLSELKRLGHRLGIVTSNITTNVKMPLGDIYKLFDEDLIFAKDLMHNYSKEKALNIIRERTRVSDRDILYIGDQKADYMAAQHASMPFIGTSYGWGISQDDNEFKVISNIKDLISIINFN